MKKKIFAALATLPIVALLAGCSYGPDNEAGPTKNSSGDTVITVGTTEADQDYWTIFADELKKKHIELKTKNFTDYTQANPSLSNGELDANIFQHLQFLADYNESANDDLTPVGATYVVPLNVYSKKHKSLEEVPQGGTVVVPNDPSNEARALLVLQAAGLISLKDGGNSLSDTDDIVKDKSKVEVKAVAAQQTLVSLDSVDAGVVNNNFVADAKDPDVTFDKAIYKDDPNSSKNDPYINVLVTTKKNANNPIWKTVLKVYHSAKVEAAVKKASGGLCAFKTNDAKSVQGILDSIEKNIREKKK